MFLKLYYELMILCIIIVVWLSNKTIKSTKRNVFFMRPDDQQFSYFLTIHLRVMFINQNVYI
jgi:hypothetical protein